MDFFEVVQKEFADRDTELKRAVTSLDDASAKARDQQLQIEMLNQALATARVQAVLDFKGGKEYKQS